MATFLDVSGLEHFSSFFVFLFVWLTVYALLQYTKVIGENQGVSVIIGLVVGLLVLFSPIAVGVIEYISPWFAVIFIFAIFASISFKTMGAGDMDMITGGRSLKALIGIVVLIVLIVGSLSYVRNEVTIPGDNETSTDYRSSSAVLFHPSVIGAIFLLIVAVFTIALLTGRHS
ncbi:MAG: hypothetical protein ABIC04_07965 [Nanoarchaeota archaeon]